MPRWTSTRLSPFGVSAVLEKGTMLGVSTPPNWYPDPQVPGLLRYWDGTRWTAHTSPATGAPTPAPKPVEAVHPTSSTKAVESDKVPLFGARKVAEQLQRENHELRAALDGVNAMELVDVQA